MMRSLDDGAEWELRFAHPERAALAPTAASDCRSSRRLSPGFSGEGFMGGLRLGSGAESGKRELGIELGEHRSGWDRVAQMLTGRKNFGSRYRTESCGTMGFF